jgi:hypothetical protein
MNTVAFIFFVIAWAMAVLGGIGAGGIGKDSRQLGERGHAQDRGWRSILSRDA